MVAWNLFYTWDPECLLDASALSDAQAYSCLDTISCFIKLGLNVSANTFYSPSRNGAFGHHWISFSFPTINASGESHCCLVAGWIHQLLEETTSAAFQLCSSSLTALPHFILCLWFLWVPLLAAAVHTYYFELIHKPNNGASPHSRKVLGLKPPSDESPTFVFLFFSISYFFHNKMYKQMEAHAVSRPLRTAPVRPAGAGLSSAFPAVGLYSIPLF